MPCPCFEPTQIPLQRTRINARLPLIDEHEGLCHATAEAVVPAADVLFRYCNHGYSRGACSCFPAGEMRSALRYSVTGETETTLELMCIEEADHAPLRWFRLQYLLTSGLLEPIPKDVCVAAQAAAFCRAYMRQPASGVNAG